MNKYQMLKYRKKPVVVEAVQWTGENDEEMDLFGVPYCEIDELGYMTIETLEGYLAAEAGDYIIKGVKGEYYPCKPDIFEETYERVEEELGWLDDCEYDCEEDEYEELTDEEWEAWCMLNA